MYHIYILKSKKTSKFYIGYTSNLDLRLSQHNAGHNKSTVHGIPWVVVYSEEFEFRGDAWKREMQIKSYKGGRAFKELVK